MREIYRQRDSYGEAHKKHVIYPGHERLVHTNCVPMPGAQTDSGWSTCILVEPILGMVDYIGCCDPPVVCETGRRCKMSFLNESNKPVIIPKGMVLGLVYLLEDADCTTTSKDFIHTTTDSLPPSVPDHLKDLLECKSKH